MLLWLHGVCDHYARRGFGMPPGDADGGDRLGYRRETALGWSRHYRDLMTGRVLVRGRQTGITAQAWRSGSTRRPQGRPRIVGSSQTGRRSTASCAGQG